MSTYWPLLAVAVAQNNPDLATAVAANSPGVPRVASLAVAVNQTVTHQQEIQQLNQAQQDHDQALAGQFQAFLKDPAIQVPQNFAFDKYPELLRLTTIQVAQPDGQLAPGTPKQLAKG